MITITDDTYKPLSLEKMITLIALLVEKSRGDDKQLHISDKDYNAIIGGKVGMRYYHTLLYLNRKSATHDYCHFGPVHV